MEIRALKSFVFVVEYASFTIAAQKLFLSQPTISSHIKNLEEELHVKLIQRNTKKVVVTKKGRELYFYAIKMVELEKNLQLSLSDEYNKIIKIGASTIPSICCLPKLIRDFSSLNKDLRFEIKQSDSADIVECLKDGTIDIGLIGAESKIKDGECIPFMKDKMVVITANNHIGKEFGEAIKEDLVKNFPNFPYIMREEGSGSKLSAKRLLEAINIDENKLNVVAHMSNQDAIVNFVKSGLGITIISKSTVEKEIESKEILAFDIFGNNSERDLFLIYNHSQMKNKNIKLFIDYIRQYYNV